LTGTIWVQKFLERFDQSGDSPYYGFHQKIGFSPSDDINYPKIR